MEDRLNDKIQEIEKYLEELESTLPEKLDEYKKNFKIRAIGERYFEKIIGATLDLAFIVVKEKGFKIPEEEKQIFDILAENNVISEKLSEKLKNAKGMRNIISHQYGSIDDELVFYSLKDELIPDIQEFIKQIEK